jgi:hypothetical protein
LNDFFGVLKELKLKLNLLSVLALSFGGNINRKEHKALQFSLPSPNLHRTNIQRLF